MRFFRPQVQRVINMVGIVTVIGAFALPLTWGYRQHHEARTWRETACAYRLKEVARQTNSLLVVPREDACATLARLGLDVAGP